MRPVSGPSQDEKRDAPQSVLIDISVEAGDWQPEMGLRKVCEQAVMAALGMGLTVLPGSELSIVFTDDAAIRDLNHRWREKDAATNVLSFPGSGPAGTDFGPLLGDIVLAQETVAREAEELGIEFQAHLSHLIVHGLLHLFEYDHQTDADAQQMEDLERRIMAKLGLDDPYGDRPLAADAG